MLRKVLGKRVLIGKRGRANQGLWKRSVFEMKDTEFGGRVKEKGGVFNRAFYIGVDKGKRKRKGQSDRSRQKGK